MANVETTLSASKDDYQIHLNFLPVEMNASLCLIYRRRCASAQEERPTPQATAHKLPAIDASDRDWQSYWVLPEVADGFEAFEYQPPWNPDLSRRILFGCLKRSVEASLRPDQYQFPANTFIQEVSLIMATHPEGNEVLVVQPYFLKDFASGRLPRRLSFQSRQRDSFWAQNSAAQPQPRQKLQAKRGLLRGPFFKGSAILGKQMVCVRGTGASWYSGAPEGIEGFRGVVR